MTCTRCGQPITDEDDARLLSWTHDIYVHTDCRAAA
jgi:hypothetical protein